MPPRARADVERGVVLYSAVRPTDIDELPVTRAFRLDERRELLRRAGGGIDALPAQALDHARLVETRHDLRVHASHDRLGRPVRRDDRIPAVDLEAGHAALSEPWGTSGAPAERLLLATARSRSFFAVAWG